MIKDLLFDAVGYLGVIVIILILIWGIFKLSNKLLHIYKYITMYHTYSKDKDLYVNKNNLIITKSGRILYSCATDSLEENIVILNKAIDECNKKIKMSEELLRLRKK